MERLMGSVLTNDSDMATTPDGWRMIEPDALTFEDLLVELRKLGSRRGWSYRGEADWYPEGKAAMGRYIAPNAPDADGAECVRLAYFQHLAHSQLNPHEAFMADDIVGWMVLAQHHGMPTRLMDWNRSVWTAAYFASRDYFVTPSGPGRDGFLWCFDEAALFAAVPPEVRQRVGEALRADQPEEFCRLIRGTPRCVVGTGVRGGTPRMVMQQGHFTLGCPIDIDHRAFIGEACRGGADVLRIPWRMKRQLMQELLSMNIHGATLYPGLDGAGQAIKESLVLGLDVPFMVNPDLASPSSDGSSDEGARRGRHEDR
jgi:hypothetical protein